MIHSNKVRKGVIAVRGRRVAVGILAVGMILGLAACSGLWNTPLQLAKLLVSDVTVTGSQGTVYIAVADMPSGGAASIEFGIVGDPGIAITGIDETTIVVEGLTGFTELAWEFTASGGSLIAANATTGVVSGQILKITFAVTAANPTFIVDETKVEIGSDLNTLIPVTTTWTLDTTTDYYTK